MSRITLSHYDKVLAAISLLLSTLYWLAILPSVSAQTNPVINQHQELSVETKKVEQQSNPAPISIETQIVTQGSQLKLPSGPVERIISYYPIEPVDLSTRSNAGFQFSIAVSPPLMSLNLNNLPVCSNAANRRIETVISVYKSGDEPTQAQALANGQLVHQETIMAPEQCVFSFTPSGFSPEQYTPYFWTVTSPSRSQTLSQPGPKWNRFVTGFAIGDLESNQEADCLKTSLLNGGSFLNRESDERPSSWWTLNSRDLSQAPRPIVRSRRGHLDRYAVVLAEGNHVLVSNLSQPLTKGIPYSFSFSLKTRRRVGTFKIKAVAFNGPSLPSLEAGKDTTIMDVTASIPSTLGNWSRVTLKPWKATKSFDHVALVIQTDDYRRLGKILLDKVCFSETEFSCEASMADAGEIMSPDFSFDNEDFIANGGIVEESEYSLGSVADIYPDADTSTVHWLGSPEFDIASECNTLGEVDIEVEYPDEFSRIEDDMVNENDYNDLLVEAEGIVVSFSEFGDTDPVFSDNEPTPDKSWVDPLVLTRSPQSCDMDTPPLDASKPFSGRDIVYVHGLVLGHLNAPATYSAKWPRNPQAFYKGGVFNTKAYVGRDINRNGDFDDNGDVSPYWRRHIERTFGPLNIDGIPITAPSNSYLVTSHSSGQNLKYAIHATLTQIVDAMNGNNAGVVQSSAGPKTCFGHNGLVIISHSTGGLVSSSMLGIIEQTKQPGKLQSFYGNLSFLDEKIHAHVAFNSAAQGSPLATLGMAKYAVKNFGNNAIVLNDVFGYNGNLQPIDSTKTILFDLHPPTAQTVWQPHQAKAKIPTLNVVSSIAGTSTNIADGFGQMLMLSYDDAVVDRSSQLNSLIKHPKFNVKKRLKLYDLGNPLYSKSIFMSRNSKARRLSPPLFNKRRFFVTPYLNPAGMLQNRSVQSIAPGAYDYVPNHYSFIQNSGTHYDNTTELDDAQYTKVRFNYYNTEDTGVVTDGAVYSKGLVHPSFSSANHELIRKKSVGFHYPYKITWNRWFKIKLHWAYKEIIIWKRSYHLLENDANKVSLDYVYQYVLR